MRYTLRQLEVFVAVAKHDSVSRAGKELGLSQSAVSEALSELEHQFDVRLFERRGKRLQLSELGRGLRPAAEMFARNGFTDERRQQLCDRTKQALERSKVFLALLEG